MGLNKKINIENLKENRAVSEAREKLRDDRTRGIVKWVFEIIVTLVFAVLVAISAFQTVTLQESAMEPTYSVSEKFFVNRALYKISSPKRGDVIVFKTSASDSAALHIRRIIGMSLARNRHMLNFQNSLTWRGRFLIYGKADIASYHHTG